ncbi:MAG TPA: hypothetical protein VLH15_02060 [Dehalococcoidales bacterium]|nr:hypothetical protein [Dehalococcoidales bacterium]
MSEKKILIVESLLLEKIDANRGDMSRSDFINFLITSHLGEDVQSQAVSSQYVTREEYQEFALGMKDLLRRFLDFFIAYGLELGQEPKDNTFAELVQKLQTLSASTARSKSGK